MKNLKLIGITILLLLTMTACGSSNGSEEENNADKESVKSKLPYDSDIQEMFDNKQGLVTFRPNSYESIDYFLNHLKIEGYRLHSYSARFGGSSPANDEAKYYYVTYEYVGWNAKQTRGHEMKLTHNHFQSKCRESNYCISTVSGRV